MKTLKSFRKKKIGKTEVIKGGGKIAYWLGYMAGSLYDAFDKSGEWIDRSGFNHQGANK